MKAGNDGEMKKQCATVYVGSSLHVTVHSPLFFVQKLRLLLNTFKMIEIQTGNKAI